MTNSTIGGNKAVGFGRPVMNAGFGGGIYNSGALTVSNTTISGNSAREGGGGIYTTGTTSLQNTIVSSSSGGNCAGQSGKLSSLGYNLSSDDTCGFKGDGDLNNTNPTLGPLQNNGGPTATMALLPGSQAIDAGNPSGCTDGLGHLLKTDQRGMPRPDKEDSGGCDMGAYERQQD